jgi:hypothetical protein
MKKGILFAVAAFMLSLGGTTGYLVKTHVPVVAADSIRAHPDSTGADSTRTDSVHHDSTTADSSVHHDSTAGPVSRPDSTRSPVAIPPAPPGSPTPIGPRRPPPPDPEALAQAYKQVARVLSAMKAPEAAKVIAFLSDDEVEGILRAVGPRQAADFLTNLPKQRAAALSRRLLAPQSKEASR